MSDAIHLTPAPSAFDRFTGWSTSRRGSLALFLWAVAEGVLWPVVPDPLLGLMGAAQPRRAPWLFLLVLSGGLVGVLLLWPLLLLAPSLLRELLIALPVVDAAMVDAAVLRVADGNPLSVMQFGSGTPLKVWAFAWAEQGGALAVFLIGAAINRVTRILPLFSLTVTASWFAGSRLTRRWPLFVGGYLLSWLVFYFFYWSPAA